MITAVEGGAREPVAVPVARDTDRLLEERFVSAELFLDEVPDIFGCTTDATPHAFLVAVDRPLAPGSEFRLRLQQERLCEECGITWDETVVHLVEAER